MKHPISHTRAWFYPSLILALAAFIGSVQANSEMCNYLLIKVSTVLDTDIVFLPTLKDSQKQAKALKLGNTQNGPEFRNGRIKMVVHFTSSNKITNLPVNFCMDVGNACESLLVWDSKLQAYASLFIIDHIVNNGPTSVYLDMLIPPDLGEKIRPKVANPLDFQIRGLVACPMRLTKAALEIELAKVPIVVAPNH